MADFTSVVQYKLRAPGAGGGKGGHIVTGTALGPASYLTATRPTLTLDARIVRSCAVRARGTTLYHAETEAIAAGVVTVKIFVAAGTEVVNTTDLSGVTFEYIAIVE